MRRGECGADVSAVVERIVSLVVAVLFCRQDRRGAWVFVYSLYFLYDQSDSGGIHIVSTLVYMGYMLVCSFAFCACDGVHWVPLVVKFVRKIYASVHID